MKNTQVVQKIRQTYKNRLFSLPTKHQYHWGLRIWRLTGAEEYLNPVHVHFQHQTLHKYPILLELAHKDLGQIGELFLAKNEPKTPKARLRHALHQTKPEILAILKLTHYLFLTKSYSLDSLPQMQVHFQTALAKLKNYDFETHFFSPEMAAINSVGMTNTFYYLQWLAVLADEEKFITTFKKLLMATKPTSDSEFQNLVYGLTHIIIAASHFYQHFVDAGKHQWILNFFEANFEDVVAKTNTDIVAEVGLCFNLCQVKSPVVEKVQDYLKSVFDSRAGLVPKEGGSTDLAICEHRNIVSVLALSEIASLNAGPNLAEFMREKHKNLYFPQSGSFAFDFSQDENE